ncbi:MAG: alpha-ketoacid dehydrogenase subunit alpha/beta [Terriglobia bacterium]
MPEASAVHASSAEVIIDFRRVARLVLLSRELDDLEEAELRRSPPKIFYQFSAKGHELAQVLLGCLICGQHDAVSAYYRSRPLLLTLGAEPADCLAASMAKLGPPSDGRDIGVVFNRPPSNGPVVLPMSGGVGAQFTVAAGWAQAIMYHRQVLDDRSYSRSIVVVLGGDGSVATNGFWSALNIATTLSLPMLFFIEDNGYALSVLGCRQTPGGNIAKNLASFENLLVLDGNGTNPAEIAGLVVRAVDKARAGAGPVLLRLRVARLSGHSGRDRQAYKGADLIASELADDPIPRLRRAWVPGEIGEAEWKSIERAARKDAEEAWRRALDRAEPDPLTALRRVFFTSEAEGGAGAQLVGGVAPSGHRFPPSSTATEPERTRVNMVDAIRRTLEYELQTNPKLLIFGEDVAAKGGVHTATLGLEQKFGGSRVFDTSLSEEGIIGRAVGMALAGLAPAPEIQFRKYAEPAAEQLNDCGTMRWRTANRFAAPIVVRMACGFSKCGDPWHSVCSEVTWAHSVGWHVAFPSNAEDAVGLLRAALRGNDPVIFLEHRALLDGPSARRPYPGHRYVLPFGQARAIHGGDDLTLVTWGGMVERCAEACKRTRVSVELLDLRTIVPWDKAAVLASVRKTSRCLIVHEDTLTAGFGAEISAVLAREAFFSLDAPIDRLAVPDIPLPYNVGLMNAVLPTVEAIVARIEALAAM